jgi:hypothetical protein
MKYLSHTIERMVITSTFGSSLAFVATTSTTVKLARAFDSSLNFIAKVLKNYRVIALTYYL